MQINDFSTIVIVCLGIVALILMAIAIIILKSRHKDNPFEDMGGDEFEEYCARLLVKQGFYNVEITKGSHDFGVDIFASKDGVKYAIQCKCYSEAVGIKAVQEVYTGKDYYDCMVAVVMTNQSFTKPAKECADKLNVLLWDGDYLDLRRMSNEINS